ncbi:hypothetical protein HY571_00435 [Candidatus Micrarchaeota archaeon]|nr:hypothetical protein [Candidatus Micrarchaeota archaeon]
MQELQGIKGTTQKIAKDLVEQVKGKEKEPVRKTSDFFTGAIASGHENSLGQATRKEYINEFIDFWKDDYRAKAKCIIFLAIAVLTFNIFTPFSLFMVALAAKYWDLALWCRNISRFNGHFRTIIYGQ